MSFASQERDRKRRAEKILNGQTARTVVPFGGKESQVLGVELPPVRRRMGKIDVSMLPLLSMAGILAMKSSRSK